MRVDAHLNAEAFDEIAYLKINRDVAEAVKTGQFRSGLDHYLQCGQQEGRAANYNCLMDQVVAVSAILKETLIEREKQIASLNEAVAKRDGQIISFNQAVAELRESTSWKLTVPVRFVGRQLLRIRAVFRALPYARAMCGGFYGLLEHV